MSRQFNWLQAYSEYTKESESPDSYHLWMGMSVLSSVARRNVFIEQNIYRLYPNMYVVLVGPPGLGKSTTIRLGKRLLLGIDEIIFGADSLTREELIRFMAKSGGEGKMSAVTLHSTELSSLIEPSKVAMVQFLIDIYDSADRWGYSTKHQGKNVIHNPFLTIVAGTVPEYLANDFPVSILGNGFTARTIFVYEEGPRFPNPFPKPEDGALVKGLIEDLKTIATLKGQFEWEPEAYKLYEEQYIKIFNSKPDDYRITDFHNRKKIHILKVAMLLSLADKDELVITTKDLIAAWEILSALEVNMPKTFAAVGKYEHASDMERIIAEIYAAGEMSAEQIYRRNSSVGDVEELARILDLGVRSGRIISEYRPAKGKDRKLWFLPGA